MPRLQPAGRGPGPVIGHLAGLFGDIRARTASPPPRAAPLAVCTDALTKLEFAALICARAFLPTVISDPCRVGHR